MLSFLTKETERLERMYLKKHMHKVQYLLFRNLLSDFLIEVYEVL